MSSMRASGSFRGIHIYKRPVLRPSDFDSPDIFNMIGEAISQVSGISQRQRGGGHAFSKIDLSFPISIPSYSDSVLFYP